MKQLGLTELFHYGVHFCFDSVVGEVADAAEVGVVDTSVRLVCAVLYFHTDFLVGIPEWHSVEYKAIYVFYGEDVVVAAILKDIILHSDFTKHICRHIQTFY